MKGLVIEVAGILYGVSVGPGDPELLTIKAANIIGKCGIIAVPQTKGENALALSIAEQAVDISAKEIVYLDFLMTKDEEKLKANHRESAEKLAVYLEKGENVALLNIGDISVYSTFSYIMDIILTMGYQSVMCPGVTSFCAAASAAGIPLVSGAETLTVTPGQNPRLSGILEEGGTKVIMKSGRSFSEVKQTILAGRPEAEVTIVENCGLKNEKIYRGLDGDEEHGYFTLFIVK